MLTRRAFASYGDYVFRQGWKSRDFRDRLMARLPRDIAASTVIFRVAAGFLSPGPVLCLGARTGGESIGATRAGFPGSVGIDLHPVGPSVIRADWHYLPFIDGSFANAYTNSLDHCYNLGRLAAEVRRVLRSDGRFYVVAPNHAVDVAAWLRADPLEALHWERADDLRDALLGFRFRLVADWRIGKWSHYVFAR